MPLDPKLQKFTTASQILVSYDYVDIEEGVGYIEFFAGEIADSTGVSQVMSRRSFNPYYEGQSATRRVGGRSTRVNLPATTAIVITKTFELEAFKVSKSIRGNLNIQIPYGTAPTASDSEFNLHVVATIYKDSDSIATATSQTATEPTDGIIMTDGMFSFDVVIPRTNFAVGEQLKIKLEVHGDYDNTITGLIIVHDPLARDITAMDAAGTGERRCKYDGGVPMKFKVPFELFL